MGIIEGSDELPMTIIGIALILVGVVLIVTDKS